MSDSIVRVIYQGARIAYRALVKSIVEEIELSQQAAKIRYQHSQEQEFTRKDMTLAEAMQILNVEKVDSGEVEKRFKFLFEVNEKNNGGSFYLQSKVFRAKQRIDGEIKMLGACNDSK
ncbi:mitochondrial import inner membrane translocase subunit TIM16-like [Tribolium castaneum]|uniref:Mitochondrial import inner membrane translocase subunit Tim16-like Protein n=1 Tax=Tribolium castaneum TaxID=7070 RepID=D6WAV6_TRICA|nr:Mitochondrial import inner membrane translocase subunit Tim16-like Protein [Tribolium castaneum]